jgi:hypothetical protein
MIIIKRRENVIPITWLSNPSIRMAFPLEQDIFEIQSIEQYAYLESYFEIIDTPGVSGDRSLGIPPCWYGHDVKIDNVEQ